MSDHDSQYDPTIPRSGGRHSRRHAETTPNDPPLPTRPASPRRVNVPLPPATRQIPPPLPAPPPSSMSRSGTSHRVAAAAANLQDNALARFAFGEELGRGGMGVVRAAEDTSLRRPLAIKLLQSPTVDGDEVAQFIEEAQITAQLEHPNIVPVHELGRDASGRPWLAMKRIEGVSLAERIEEWRRRARSRPLAAEDIHSILSLFDKVCDALAFAHSRRVIHRDIKPANIMVGSFGEVLLVDWGLARPLDAGDGRDSFVRSSRREGGEQMTMQGDVFGTPAFMPPEQAEGLVDEIDQRSDIFSLGGVLYNMLTLEVPYDSATGASRALVMAARWQLVPPRRRAPQRHIPRELDAIVMKAMAADPADRYRSVQALKDDLAAWQSLRPTTAWRAGPIDRLVKLMRRNPTWSLSAAVLVLASLVVVMLVQQLAASEQALALAEAREAQQTAQRERAEADARARAADAEKAHEREVAALERERLLRQLAPVQVTKDRDAAIDAFYAEIEQARQRGMNTRRHIINMDESKVREALDAFNRFERMANATEGLSMTADDFCTRGMLKWKLRDWKDAIADFTAALDLDPHHHDSLEWRGMTWLDTGDVQHCVDDMTRLIEMDPRRLSAWLNRGNAYKVAGNLDRAFSDYSQAVFINGDSVEALVARGEIQYMRHNLKEAHVDIDRALALQPTNTTALGVRGVLRYFAGDHEGAIKDYNAVLEINPRFAEVVCNRGLAQRALGHIDDALADFSRAIEIDPRQGLFWRNRGDAYWQTGDTGRALADYDEGIRRDPRPLETWMQRSRLRVELKDYPGAIADCDEMIRRSPQNWRAWFQRAVAAQTTDRAMTVESLQQAYRFCDVPASKSQIADNLRQLGAPVPE